MIASEVCMIRALVLESPFVEYYPEKISVDSPKRCDFARFSHILLSNLLICGHWLGASHAVVVDSPQRDSFLIIFHSRTTRLDTPIHVYQKRVKRD